MLCYSRDGLCTSLTTLPSEALQTEALKLFKVTWEWSPGLLAVGAHMCSGSAWHSSAHPSTGDLVIMGWPEGCGEGESVPQESLYGRNVTLLQARRSLWGSGKCSPELSLEEPPPPSSIHRKDLDAGIRDSDLV